MISLTDTILKCHKRYRFTTHVLFWVIIYGIGIYFKSLHSDQPTLSFSQNVVWHGMIILSKIPIAYITVYYIVPLFFEEKKYSFALIQFFIAYFLLFCLVNFYKATVYPHFDMAVATDWSAYSLDKFFLDFFINNLGVIGFLILTKLLLNHTENQQNNLRLEKEKSLLELRLLKSQLNPHFLFNTLNNIYSLSIQNSPKTSESIARLSEILDYILYRSGDQLTTLTSEVKLLENYIELEKLRYSDRLNISFQKSIENEVEIAPLLLLSVVENAFKHGAGEDIGNPRIHIQLNVKGHEIEFIVENTFTPHQALEEKAHGIGINNLKQQLELIYSKNHKISFIQNENIFRVEMKINTK